MQTKAAILLKFNQVVVDQITLPSLKPGQVLVEIHYTGEGGIAIVVGNAPHEQQMELDPKELTQGKKFSELGTEIIHPICIIQDIATLFAINSSIQRVCWKTAMLLTKLNRRFAIWNRATQFVQSLI